MPECDRRADCLDKIVSFTFTSQVGYSGNGRSSCGGECPTNTPPLISIVCIDGDLTLANGSTTLAGTREARVEMCF